MLKQVQHDTICFQMLGINAQTLLCNHVKHFETFILIGCLYYTGSRGLENLLVKIREKSHDLGAKKLWSPRRRDGLIFKEES
jgi:hypothetical protein